MAVATFGAGCFWGVEQFIREIDGVTAVRCGYMGGHLDNPTYAQVKAGDTGHAEVVQLEFDPVVVSFEQLLQVFWQYHNPTTVHQQGEDVGSQYRSVVFYHNDNQKIVAEQTKHQISQTGYWAGNTIVTEIVPATTFWDAEEYHQNYFGKHELPSCHLPFF
ncbi:peptide-methionine (S)-S-oxide reductase MsrA [Ferrimonas lipolytica]|uniref:Peptide methionine sulfoxide reductase MsrA n=1 Tax=Ferrimonas lipolytica TaxID=2724191 RepID=A0A6H1UAT2_9GAMM|nr:peptide-methionine (S)-S-oxide reductase MsrA [Ferrimonas lipolytica]QIZ76161.1 peptide-methionine (S)-S-oxide reductase MsrA [Ferrimonas lipolytica]